MSDVWFYHLQRASLEETLPRLVTKARGAGWRVAIRTTSPERRDALDDLLWTFEDDGFLPHATEADPQAAAETVLIQASGADLNAPDAVLLVDGAPMPDDPARYQRVILIFDGNDDAALAAARERWRAVKSAGHQASYWAQDESGRWVKKA
ncbi:DNA polymerase III subunit chi [Salinarimonas ramus]|uniref:DNA polymerase III subunit chi n=1 Tax=Salinarimonas ramus TaxID=690164 RepID=A0A917Q797_9HYPH|nr:DNA polymerase III subunit chi [Salinarimonas ramus]GGK32364.1 DNA polymerase III subunit chi [Salinarimonas ramus]